MSKEVKRMPIDFGLEEDEELGKEGSGSNLSAVLKEPVEEKPKPIEINIKGEIKALLISADKAIQRRNHKGAQAAVRKAMKLLEEL